MAPRFCGHGFAKGGWDSVVGWGFSSLLVLGEKCRLLQLAESGAGG